MRKDLKFAAKHFNHIDRLAIVGDSAPQRGMALFCKPATTAQVRSFTPEQQQEASDWVHERD